MADARVVDTNVLIVASAADVASPFRPDATPVEEAEYRALVSNWVKAFEKDASRHAVLDVNWHIAGEYSRKLDESQDYGFLVMMKKMDQGQVTWVDFPVDANGHAILSEPLTIAVTDRDDRKMVAAALHSMEQGIATKLVNACDTDWLDCEIELRRVGLECEHILEHLWLRPKWEQMKASK